MWVLTFDFAAYFFHISTLYTFLSLIRVCTATPVSQKQCDRACSPIAVPGSGVCIWPCVLVLPGEAPVRGGFADQHSAAGGPRGSSPRREGEIEEEMRTRGRILEGGGMGWGAVHESKRGRWGTRDTSEQVENRRCRLSLFPEGWRERSRVRLTQEKKERVKM